MFSDTVINFAVWFILSIFAFSLGWIITNTLDWNFGGKVVFSVIIVTSFITMFFITIFNDYFNLNGVLTENILLYVLRNIFIGLMGVFGMAVSKLIELQRVAEVCSAVNERKESIIKMAEEKADLIISKAKLEAEKITHDAGKEVSELKDVKSKLETTLKEFIELEKELLRNYSDEK